MKSSLLYYFLLFCLVLFISFALSFMAFAAETVSPSDLQSGFCFVSGYSQHFNSNGACTSGFLLPGDYDLYVRVDGNISFYDSVAVTNYFSSPAGLYSFVYSHDSVLMALLAYDVDSQVTWVLTNSSSFFDGVTVWAVPKAASLASISSFDFGDLLSGVFAVFPIALIVIVVVIGIRKGIAFLINLTRRF